MSADSVWMRAIVAWIAGRCSPVFGQLDAQTLCLQGVACSLVVAASDGTR